MARRVIPASASIRTVCRPARAVKVAALAPAGPPPTIATSYIRAFLLWDEASRLGTTCDSTRSFPHVLSRPHRCAWHLQCFAFGRRLRASEAQRVGYPFGIAGRPRHPAAG